MCWPQLVGGVEVEERRPRTWNEPRRKRLNFVRGHQRDSDEWLPAPHQSRHTEQELWDRRRAREMEQQRFMNHIPHPQLQGHHDPRMIPLQHAPQMHHIQHGHHPGFDQQGHHGQQPQLNYGPHHSDNDIVAIEDLDDDDHDDHDHHHRPQLEPHIIYREPPKSHLPKGIKVHASKSGGHKKKYSISSSLSDDSSSSDGFSEGFRAGRRSLSRRHGARGRSRSRRTDDSFEDLMEPRVRSRSSRGRR